MNSPSSDPLTSDLHPTGEFVPESRWPLVLGTISILYASFGILFMLVTLVGVFLGPWLQASLAGMKPVPVPPLLLVGQATLALSGLVLGIILLMGGILTIRRRRRGPKLVSFWVVARLALLLVGVAFAFLTLDLNLKYQERVQDAVVELMRNNDVPEDQIEASIPGRGMTRQSMITWTLAFGGILAIYPVIAGLMLSGRGVREELQDWS